MKIKLDSKLASHASDSLGLHAASLYATLGKRVIGIVEFSATERGEVAPDESKDTSVKLQIKHLEIAGEEQEDAVRQAMRALYAQRTAFGTLNEDSTVELSERTLANCAGELNAIEAARLHVAIENWERYARSATRTEDVTVTELRHELTIIADALHATLYPGASPRATTTDES